MNSVVRPLFTRLLVPYDGSEPAQAALRYALSIAHAGTRIAVVTIVDVGPIVAETSAAMVVFDPGPMMAALEEQAQETLAGARILCAASASDSSFAVVQDTPVRGILGAVTTHASDLIIMGTHARTGLAHTFMGSTAEGVVRGSAIPVIAIRTADRVTNQPFATAVVAIDDSDPADAAACVAATFVRDMQMRIVAAHAIATEGLYDNFAIYGCDRNKLIAALRNDGRAIVERALSRAALSPLTPIDIREGDQAAAICAVAHDCNATLIIAGTHGRRGLRRFFLGSVAAQLIRTSTMPVLIVPLRASMHGPAFDDGAQVRELHRLG